MQVGINTSSVSHLKFNFEFADQKLKSIEKGFQIGSCKIIQSYRLSLSSLRLGQLLIGGHFNNYENRSDKPFFLAPSEVNVWGGIFVTVQQLVLKEIFS